MKKDIDKELEEFQEDSNKNNLRYLIDSFSNTTNLELNLNDIEIDVKYANKNVVQTIIKKGNTNTKSLF